MDRDHLMPEDFENVDPFEEANRLADLADDMNDTDFLEDLDKEILLRD